MTYKRFNYVAFDGFEDNGEFITPHQVVTLLNELYKEKEQLKDALNQRTDQCDEYYKENEELKHSIKCLEADKMELQQYIKRMQGDVE